MALGLSENVDVTDLLVEHNADGSHKQASNLKYGLNAAKAASPVVGDVYCATDTTQYYVCFSAGVWTELGSGSDEKVKVSSDDTTPGYLNGKLVEGEGIDFLEQGGNETLRVSAQWNVGNPAPIGTAAPGAGTEPARWNHVHAGDHVNLASIGTNTHAQIDTHIADEEGVHGLQNNIRLGGYLSMKTAEVEVVYTTDETALYTFTVPGGTLSTNNLLRLQLVYSFLNNTGGLVSSTVRARLGGLGGTTMCSFAPAKASGASRAPVRVELFLKGDTATNVQRAAMFAHNLGTSVGGSDVWLFSEGTAARDSTVNQDLVISIQHTAASNSLSAIMRMCLLEWFKNL